MNQIKRVLTFYVSSAGQSLWLELHYLKETEAAPDKLLSAELGTG